MKVSVKVPMNDTAIEAAKTTNAENAKKIEAEKNLSKSVRGVYTDVDIPERIIEDKDMIIDPFNIIMATISHNNMIQIVYETKFSKMQFEFVHTEEKWNEIEEAMNLSIEARRKALT